MLNKKLFDELLTSYTNYTKLRDQIIIASRDVLRNSKQAIFALHRDELVEAEKILNDTENKILNIEKLLEKRLKDEGSYKEGLEEFIEAFMFSEFLKNGQINFKSKVKADFNDLIGGICDLTGEIVRKAVQAVTKGENEKIKLYQAAVQSVVGELIKFDLLGKHRGKYDQAKRNLRKIEEIAYDLKIRE
jgi:predicted translin family RNA/ssDNA-binding protein